MRHKHFIIVLILSAFLSGYAYLSANMFLVFVSWSGFFSNIFLNFTKKQVLINGFVFGFFYGVCLFSWTVDVLQHYSSLSSYSFFVALLLSIYYGLYYSVLSYFLFWFYKKSIVNNKFLCLAGVVALFVLIEELFSFLYQGIPFINLRLGFILSKSLFLIQLSSIAGVAYLSFLVVLINALIANFFITKNRKSIVLAILFLSMHYGIGYLLFINNERLIQKEIKVCAVSANINPEISWSEETGNTLAYKFINLSKQSSALNPDFILWPEAIFPWTYDKDDDLINEILKPQTNKPITHVLGLNRINKSQPNKIYASATFLSNKNKSYESFYIKKISLKGFEKPLFGLFQIPFLYSDAVFYNNIGKSDPIETKNGKIGVLICNEIVEQSAVLEQVKKGAECFFILSNDGWFKDTYIAKYHFYIARIMAVMYNRDFALSSNCGINGFIANNGTIISQKQLDTPLCEEQATVLTTKNTIYTNFPYVFVLLLLQLFLLNILLTLKTNNYEKNSISFTTISK